jgi:hypothetical protein
VLRRSHPADRRGYADSQLTPDGRFYCWLGPREPESQRRIEVYEVGNPHVVKVVPPSDFPQLIQVARLSPDGHSLYVEAKAVKRVYDLAANNPPEDVPAIPAAVSEGRWLAFWSEPEGSPGLLALSLRAGLRTPAWLELMNPDQSGPTPITFSRNGRYLAWGSLSGAVTVADLHSLQQLIEAFEKDFLGN